MWVGRTAKKKNFIVQSLANMIFIHNILTSYENDSCFNKRIPLRVIYSYVKNAANITS